MERECKKIHGISSSVVSVCIEIVIACYSMMSSRYSMID